jgi:hypothetical protein
MKRSGRILMLLVCGSLVLGCLQGGCASEVARAETQPPAPAAQPSTQELDQLVAPIALYPDALIAQILAGATYPSEIVEADRWLQQHPDLKGDALAKAVDARVFAAIAYPVKYRSSGVMTFVVTQDGGVLEKDLGPNTAKVAGAMTSYHSDATWTPAESKP